MDGPNSASAFDPLQGEFGCFGPGAVCREWPVWRRQVIDRALVIDQMPSRDTCRVNQSGRCAGRFG